MTLHALVNNQPKQIVGGFIGVNGVPRSIRKIYIGNEDNQPVLCFKRKEYNYVSFGDSIAAGHSINDSWATDYGTGSQYGEKKNESAPVNTKTQIVPKSYTNLIHNYLQSSYKSYPVTTKSFAHSGDKNNHLRDKLNHQEVIEAVKEANIVTVCIGANTVLGAVEADSIPKYLAYGNPALLEIENKIAPGFTMLACDENVYGSYKNIFKRLAELNTDENTRFVFTSIYNPYKYLWLDQPRNEYTSGYFSTIFNWIPDLTWDLPWLGEVGLDVRKYVYEYEYMGASLKLITERIDGLTADSNRPLSDWVEDQVTKLNSILKKAINEFGDTRFIFADTKSLYESAPDRIYSAATKKYNDLVNVELVRGTTIGDLDWGKFWSNFDFNNVDIARLDKTIQDMLMTIVEKVILPDVDPHPEEDGQYFLYRSFADALGWQNLARYTITFNANGGNGSMTEQKIVGVGDYPAYVTLNTNNFTHPQTGYRFIGWNTKPDGSGTSYSNGQYISLTSDLTLYAQWSDMYTVRYIHTNHTNLYPNEGNTGHQECYELWIGGRNDNPQPKFGNFSDGEVKEYMLPYNNRVGIVTRHYKESGLSGYLYKDADCGIYFNGEMVASGTGEALYDFSLTSNITIDFRWKISGSLVTADARSWEDCYITTW